MSVTSIIAAILAAIPAIDRIMTLMDKWFTDTPAEKAAKELKRQVNARKKAAREANQAIKEARRGRQKRIEELLNRP